METPLKTGFAQIFSCYPKNLSCPKFGVGGGGGGGGGGGPPPPPCAPPPPPARTPMPTTPLLTFRLWSTENQIVGVGSRSGRINQSFPRFVIGLVVLLLLPTPTIWFSLDHKRNVSDGVVSGIGTLFSLDHKLYTSDNDSSSVASVNQRSI